MKKIFLKIAVLYVYNVIAIQFKKIWEFIKFTAFLIIQPQLKIHWQQYVGSRPHGACIAIGKKMCLVIDVHWNTLSESRSNASHSIHDYDYYSYVLSFRLRWHNNATYRRLLGDAYNFVSLISFHVRPPKQQFRMWLRKIKNSAYYKYAFGYDRNITVTKRIGRITLIGAIIDAYTLANEMCSNEVSDHMCLSDPMNGCPGDFSESFQRRSNKMWNEYEDIPLPEKFKALLYTELNGIHWKEYNENPAPWDWDDFPNDEEPKPTGLLHRIKTLLFGDYTAKDSAEYWDVDEEIHNDEVTVKF